MNGVRRANRYVKGVLKNPHLYPLTIHQACLRYEADKLRDDFYLDEGAANYVVTVVESMPHTKGELQGKDLLLEDWQCFFYVNVFGWKWTETKTRRFRYAFLFVPRKNGKALALDTEIPTPSGFAKMGELSIGDLVIGSDGKPCSIIGESEIFTDHDCYELTFSTGEKVIADAGHRWVTDSRSDRDRMKGRGNKNQGAKPSVKTTEDIAKTLEVRGEKNHRVCLGSFSGKSKNFNIPPYVLGFWLGDGNSSSNHVYCNNKDSEVIDYISELGELTLKKDTSDRGCSKYLIGGSGINNSLYSRLRKLDLLNNKHIPEQYFLGSINQRLELLKGLMDSDGFCSKSGQCVFYNKNERLAKNVFQLVNSLGIKASLGQKKAKLYGKDCGVCYQVQFWAYSDNPVFKLTRKSDRQKQRPKSLTRTFYRQIVAAKKINPVPVKCIAVDSPDNLFLCTRSYIPTHNTAMAIPAALLMFAVDQEKGAEVYLGAVGEQHAKRLLFKPARYICDKWDEFRERYNIQVNASSIIRTDNDSVLTTVIKNPNDGDSPHCAVIDEYHEHKDSTQYETFDTGMGARNQPLLLVITTAGTDLSSPCKTEYDDCLKVLNGSLKEDDKFALVYAPDESDEWDDVRTLRKVNPNMGVSVHENYLLSQLDKAKQSAEKQNAFKTKHMNIWVGSKSAWMNMDKWQKQSHSLPISDFAGEDCHITCDLASTIDVSAIHVTFRMGDDYYSFPFFYVPEEALQRIDIYNRFVNSGHLITTDGQMTDYEILENKIIELSANFNVLSVSFDPHQATYLQTRLRKGSLDGKVFDLAMNRNNLSEPMNEMEGRVANNQYWHDGNECMTWMVGNTCDAKDAGERSYPVKENRNDERCHIDGSITAIMGVARWLEDEVTAVSAYEQRGFRTL